MKKKFGKKALIFIFTLLTLTIATVVAVFAANYTVKDVKWEFSINGENATITKVVLNSKTEEFKIPSKVKDDSTGNEYTVTAIGNNAFQNNKNVFGELTLPKTLTSIGSSAFEGTYIYGKVDIPRNVTSIGSSAFKNCDGITEVSIPSSIIKIENSTFEDCYALGKINTENVVTFGEKCFYNCRALYDFTISQKAKTIQKEAFYNCDAIEGTLDNSMLTAISSNAFQNCDRIETVILPNSGVDFGAYNGCSGLQNYEVLDTNKTYSSIDGVLHSKDGTEILKYPSTRKDEIYKVSDSVTTINTEIFKGTTALKEVVLTKNVTTLKERAFTGSSIEFIYIPDSVKIVEFDTFKDCKKLKTVILGEGVEVVGAGAFTGSTVSLIIAGNDMITPISTSGGKFYYASEYRCTEHIYGYNDNPPTCEKYGYNKCIACLRYEYLKETDHNGAIIESAPATCTEDGYRVVECMDCGKTARAVTEEALGHVSNGTVYTIMAGYKSPKLKYSTCLVCENMYVYEYTANFHILGDVNCDSTIDHKDLTALESYVKNENSVTEFLRANADIARDGKVDAADINLLRSYLAGEVDSLPSSNYNCTNHGKKISLEIVKHSCETDGFRIRYCDNCGLLTDELYTKKLDHTLTDVHEILPTCALSGQRRGTCTTCNKTIYERIEQLEHTRNWYAVAGQRGHEYSTCTVCGEFEHRTVDYAEFEKLIESLPLICTCSGSKCASVKDKLTTHLVKNYYKQETYNAILAILENYNSALTQAEIDKNVENLFNTLKSAQYNVTDVPSVFIETVPDSQSQGYISTRIIIASIGEDGKPKVDAMDYSGKVKIRGRSSDDHAKKPYNIKFSSSVDLFGMGSGKKYCLLSNYQDSTLLKNALMFEVSHLFGIENSCKYQVVDLYTKGNYAGSYLLVTPCDVGEDRIEIDEDEDFLIEIEKEWDTADGSMDQYEQELLVSPIFRIRAAVNAPEIKDMSGKALSLFHQHTMNIDFAIYSGDWELIQKYVDVESIAKYYVLHDYLKEIDIIWDSTRFYIEDGVLYGGPAWDFDLSMYWNHNTGGGTAFNEHSFYKNLNSNTMCEGGVVGETSTGEWASLQWYANGSLWNSSETYIYFRALYRNSPEFVELICQTVADLNDEMTLIYDSVIENGILIEENIIDTIVLDEQISGSIKRNNDALKGGYASYSEDVKSLRNWLQKRNEWMQKHYAEKLLEMQK